MSDHIIRDRLRGDQTEPVQGPTLTEKALALDDAGFKLSSVREKARVSHKRRSYYHYEGVCSNPHCGKDVKTPSHPRHQTATDLAFSDMCPHCGTTVIGAEIIASISNEIAAEAATA